VKEDKLKRFAAPLTLIFLFAAPAIGSQALIDFEIKDQHGAEHTAARFEGRPLLALWGDRLGNEFMQQWSLLLADSLQVAVDVGRLGRIDVAHAKGAPFFVKGKIKKRFQQQWPRPVLIDWKGKFLQAYECSSDSCTVLLFDTEGRLARRWTTAEPDSSTVLKIMEATRQAASLSR
jgi:hypothetical protein